MDLSDTGHIPPFSMNTGILFSRKYFSTASAVSASLCAVLVEFARGLKSSILIWTYRFFDEPKVVIMDNSHGVFSNGVLVTFLLNTLSTSRVNNHVRADEPLRYSPGSQ